MSLVNKVRIDACPGCGHVFKKTYKGYYVLSSARFWHEECYDERNKKGGKDAAKKGGIHKKVQSVQ